MEDAKEVREECGIIGVYLKKPSIKKTKLVPELLYIGLSQLQHRGQLSAGISVYNPFNKGYEKRLKLLREVGMVDDLFIARDEEKSKKIINYCKGIAGIGHVRYATAGCAASYLDLLEETQPFLRHHGRPWKRFSIVFNGNLANYLSLKKEMSREGYLLDTEVDTEIIMHLMSLNLKSLSVKDEGGKDAKPSLFDVSKKLIEKFDGAYNIMAMFADGDLVVLRDPLAFKPLVWGENSDFYAVASESIALEKMGIERFFQVEPGNCMIFNKEGVSEKNICYSERKARCHFERVYFSKANSIIDGKSVNSTRECLGRSLAEIEPLKHKFKKYSDEYVVVPVPKTAIPAAEAYAKALNLHFTLALDKAEGKRGFINKERERKRIMHREYGLIGERIKGKKVIVIEDSIVRGETSKEIVSILKKAGVLEVHWRSTEPPIKYPCFYGIDFPTYKELIATRFKDCKNIKSLENAVAEEIGVNSVVYQRIEGLVKSLGFGVNESCFACLTGEYPTPAGEMMAQTVRTKDKILKQKSTAKI